MLFAENDSQWTTLIVAIATAVVTAISAWLKIKMDQLAKTANATHALVNGNMTVQLRFVRDLTRELAAISPSEAHALAASTAERIYREHQAKQGIVDRVQGEK